MKSKPAHYVRGCTLKRHDGSTVTAYGVTDNKHPDAKPVYDHETVAELEKEIQRLKRENHQVKREFEKFKRFNK